MINVKTVILLAKESNYRRFAIIWWMQSFGSCSSYLLLFNRVWVNCSTFHMHFWIARTHFLSMRHVYFAIQGSGVWFCPARMVYYGTQVDLKAIRKTRKGCIFALIKTLPPVWYCCARKSTLWRRLEWSQQQLHLRILADGWFQRTWDRSKSDEWSVPQQLPCLASSLSPHLHILCAGL